MLSVSARHEEFFCILVEKILLAVYSMKNIFAKIKAVHMINAEVTFKPF